VRYTWNVFGLSKRALIVIGVLVGVAVLFAIQNGKNGNAQSGASNGGGGACQMQVTADVLNVRTAADGKSQVVAKLATGAITGATTTVRNGYRELSANHWVANQFVKQVSGSC
jgi:hypothetical protein